MLTPRLSATLGLTFVSLTLFHGCSTTKRVEITSEPVGAQITGFPNKPLTPYSTNINFKSKSEGVRLTVSKEGYKAAPVEITYLPKDKRVYHVQLVRELAISRELVSYEPVLNAAGVVRLAFVTAPTRAYLDPIEKSANVAAVTQVTANEDPSTYIGPISLSPKSDELVYCIYLREGSKWISTLEQIAIGSFAKTKLTTGKYFDFFPSYSADGQTVIFCSNRTSENPILWRIKVTGTGGIERITNTQAEDFSSSVGPDTKVIAYSSNLPGADQSQIWTIPFGGGLSTQLREGYNPQISPDGKTILFIRTDRRAERQEGRPIRQIWKMNIDGSGETQLSRNVAYDYIDAKWSPDGKYIVYASDEGRDSEGYNNYDIWMMRADGSNQTQLTTNGSRDDGPGFDRSGRKIYFRSNRGGNWNIWSFELLAAAATARAE